MGTPILKSTVIEKSDEDVMEIIRDDYHNGDCVFTNELDNIINTDEEYRYLVDDSGGDHVTIFYLLDSDKEE